MRNRKLALVMVTLLALLMVACQAVPSATPTKAPTPTQAAPLAAPTATVPPAPSAPTATLAPPATPTKVPATSTPMPKSKGKVVLVASGEPASMDVIINSYVVETRPVYANMVEQLTQRNPKTFAIEGQLAAKWEQTKPDTWRYTLRKGVKFHNGEPFNADAVVYTMDRTTTKELASGGLRYLATGTKTVKVDDLTVEITSTSPDPIQPLRVMNLPIVAPKWAKENPEELPTKVIGTAPYKFVEWVKGQYLKMTAFEDYWGGAPNVKDVTIIWRAEGLVRAAMVKTGEADWAFNLAPEDVKDIAKVSTVPGNEVFFVRYDIENPVLQDKRVRTALSLGVDKATLVDSLFKNAGALASGQLVADYVLGYNPAVKNYPYDPDKARQLLAEAKAAGVPVDQTELELWVAKGRFPRIEEATESLADTWNKLGVKTKVVIAESAKWRDMSFSVLPGQKRAALMVGATQNDLGDSSETYQTKIVCGSRTGSYCNAALDAKAKKAEAAVGDERVKLYQEIWKELYDDAPYLPMFVSKPINGLSKRLTWDGRMDQRVMVQEMSLSE